MSIIGATAAAAVATAHESFHERYVVVLGEVVVLLGAAAAFVLWHRLD
jgi:hypothetical protein